MCPLHLAAKRGNIDGIEFAIKYNIHIAVHDPKCKPFNLNKKGGNELVTPLHLACA